VGLILLATNAHYFNLFVAPGANGKPAPIFPNDQFRHVHHGRHRRLVRRSSSST